MKVNKIIFIFLIVFITCCGRSLPTKYYLLETSGRIPAELSNNGKIVGIGPVSLPSYLDRKGIVTRTGSNQVNISDLNLWAESLDANILRVIKEELITDGSAEKVELYPFSSKLNYFAKVSIDILHFERLENGDVLLTARYNLEKGVSSETKIFTANNSCEGSDYANHVSCMSSALNQLAKDISKSL